MAGQPESRAMLDRSRQTQPIIIRNNAAIAVWVFMAVWMGMLCLFTYIFMRDGGIPDFGLLGPVFFGVFWLGGLGATAWALSQPRIRVTIAGQRVVTRESWLWRARERRYDAAQLRVPELLVDKDSDGDPYFKCLLRLPDGVLTVAEGHARPKLEAVCARLLSVLPAV